MMNVRTILNRVGLGGALNGHRGKAAILIHLVKPAGFGLLGGPMIGWKKQIRSVTMVMAIRTNISMCSGEICAVELSMICLVCDVVSGVCLRADYFVAVGLRLALSYLAWCCSIGWTFSCGWEGFCSFLVPLGPLVAFLRVYEWEFVFSRLL